MILCLILESTDYSLSLFWKTEVKSQKNCSAKKYILFKWFSKLSFLLCLLESLGFSRVRNYILFITRPGHQALNRTLDSRFYARGRIIRLNELGQTFVVGLLMRLKYKDGHNTKGSFLKTDDDWCASCFCYFENEMAWLKSEQIPHLVSLVNLICW